MYDKKIFQWDGLDSLIMMSIMHSRSRENYEHDRTYNVHGGYINFYNQDCMYVVRESPAIISFLEDHGFREDPEVWTEDMGTYVVQMLDIRTIANEVSGKEVPFSFNFEDYMKGGYPTVSDALDDHQYRLLLAYEYDHKVKDMFDGITSLEKLFDFMINGYGRPYSSIYVDPQEFEKMQAVATVVDSFKYQAAEAKKKSQGTGTGKNRH